MKFGQLDIDPARSPGILDTGTWAPDAAWQKLASLDDAQWAQLAATLREGGEPLALQDIALHHRVQRGAGWYILAGLPDGQQVFLRLGSAATAAELGTPAASRALPAGQALDMYPADAAMLDRFFRLVDGTRGPRALGPVPRLGIGTRMTTLVWPAIWQAMLRGGCAANAIQNSVRELNLLPDLLAGRPPERNVAFNFGTIESGYTGSTFEGLWVAGVLSALQAREFPATGYGADADHIQVKRGAGGLERALRLVDASRYYTFYTLDVSDVLDYGVMFDSSPEAVEARLAQKMPDGRLRAALLSDYARPASGAGRLDATTVARLAVKYWDALAAAETLAAHIASLKGGAGFDLELSIDEHPGDVATVDCLTGEDELAFVLREARRRGIPLTHVAPNYGVEKGVDYACPDGLAGLERRAARLGHIAEEFGTLADFHSGDDLSQATRLAIRRGSGRRLHFKVSPMLQLLFADVLADYHPELFRLWWDDACAYARREAAAGSSFAAACLQQADPAHPAALDPVFHHFSFAFVGRRDANGQFLHRETFYSLSQPFRQAYAGRITAYLLGLATDLF